MEFISTIKYLLSTLPDTLCDSFGLLMECVHFRAEHTRNDKKCFINEKKLHSDELNRLFICINIFLHADLFVQFTWKRRSTFHAPSFRPPTRRTNHFVLICNFQFNSGWYVLWNVSCMFELILMLLLSILLKWWLIWVCYESTTRRQKNNRSVGNDNARMGLRAIKRKEKLHSKIKTGNKMLRIFPTPVDWTNKLQSHRSVNRIWWQLDLLDSIEPVEPYERILHEVRTPWTTYLVTLNFQYRLTKRI